jgi:hypothetical protein
LFEIRELKFILLHNEEHHDLYSSPNFNYNNEVEDDEMGGACNTNGGRKGTLIGGKARRKEATRKTKT